MPPATIGGGAGSFMASSSSGGQQSCAETGAATNIAMHGDIPADMMLRIRVDVTAAC